MSRQDALIDPRSSSLPKAPGRRWSPRRVRLVGFIAGFALVAGLVVLGFWLATTWRSQSASTAVAEPVRQKAPPEWERTVVADSELADRVGVRITQVAVTGGGGLLDLRFKVIDPDKAASIHDQATPPIIIDQATGVVVDQLLMGHSHSEPFKAGVTYYLVFENPGNLVQQGGKVSVLLGDAQVDEVEVK